MDRLKKELEYAEGKVKSKCNEEKEAMKKEYEDLISNLRLEYTRLTETLRGANEAQSGEITMISSHLRAQADQHRREKAELDDQLIRDKYQLDACQAELRALREAKLRLQEEQEQLYDQVKDRELETKACLFENKELKIKIKKLEQILYGRSMK